MFYLLYTKSIHKHDVVSKGPVDIKLNLYSWACSFILYQSNKWLYQKEFCL